MKTKTLSPELLDKMGAFFPVPSIRIKKFAKE